MRNLISYFMSRSGNALDRRSDDLLEECESLKRQIRELSLRCSAAEDELATRHDELTARRQQCAALQREVTRLASPERTDGERDQLVAELKGQLKSLRVTIDALHKQTERAETRSSGLQLLVAEKSNKLQQAEARVQLAQREAERQLERFEQARAEVRTLRATHAKLIDEHQTLQTLYETLEQDAVAAVEANEREIAALTARIGELSSAGDAARSLGGDG